MRFEDHAYILAVVASLREQGSWTGRTHVQKAMYLADYIYDTPFDFTLYKHGPYSFDLDSELDLVVSYGGVRRIPAPPYGPQFKVGEGSTHVPELASKDAREAIEKACRLAGNKDITHLEALATLAWIWKNNSSLSDEEAIEEVISLKPHLSEELVQTELSEFKKAGLKPQKG